MTTNDNKVLFHCLLVDLERCSNEQAGNERENVEIFLIGSAFIVKECFSMGQPERRMQFAKNVKMLDWLKTELLDQVSNLFKGLYHANQHLMIEAIASLLICIYVLGRRVGFTYREVDQVVTEKLRDHSREGHQLERWYGDLSTLEEYMNKR